MSPLQRVLWSEGMIMSPHHLQQQDLYHEGLLDARLRAHHPHTWGVVAQEIDAEALSAGQFQLLRFSGILPDGLLVDIERGQAEAPPPRPVEEHFKPSQRVLEVYLGVPKEREGAEHYANGDTPSRGVRFLATQRPVADLSASSSVISVPFARRNLMVLFGGESREDFEALKIAELTRDKTGGLKAVDTYVPPCLRVEAAPLILHGLRSLLRLTTSKQRELARTRRFREAASVEITGPEVIRTLQLHTLNGLIPFLQHAVEVGGLSPLQVYRRLIDCAGQLHTFAEQGDPSRLPSFQYTNLRATFEELFSRFNELLSVVAMQSCLSIPLEPRAEGFYHARLEDERLPRCPAFILAVHSDLSERLVADQFPRLVKISTTDEIHQLVDSALSGISVQVALRPPPEVPLQPGVVYFIPDTTSPRWKSALREQSLVVYLPSPFEPGSTRLELLAVPPPEHPL